MNFKQLISDLECISRSNTFALEEFSQVFRKIDSSLFIDLISELQNNQNIRNDIFNHSYLHQNGFYKLVIHTRYDLNWRLRLHIWDTQKNCDYDIHNHSWGFVSCVLKGSLINEIYEKSTIGKSFNEFTYVLNNESLESSLISSGSNNLYLSNYSEINSFNVYSQESHVFHRTYPKEGKLTVSLIIQQKPFKNESTVFKNEKRLNSTNYLSFGKPLTEKSLDELLKKLVVQQNKYESE